MHHRFQRVNFQRFLKIFFRKALGGELRTEMDIILSIMRYNDTGHEIVVKIRSEMLLVYDQNTGLKQHDLSRTSDKLEEVATVLANHIFDSYIRTDRRIEFKSKPLLKFGITFKGSPPSTRDSSGAASAAASRQWSSHAGDSGDSYYPMGMRPMSGSMESAAGYALDPDGDILGIAQQPQRRSRQREKRRSGEQ